MKKIDVSQAITVVANVGVLAGIAFLAVELNQNTRSLEIGAYQNLIDQVIQMNRDGVQNPDGARMIREGTRRSISDLNADEFEVVSAYITLLYRYGDLAYYQYERGTLSEERLQSALRPLTDSICFDTFREVWSSFRVNFVPAYQRYVDSIVSMC